MNQKLMTYMFASFIVGVLVMVGISTISVKPEPAILHVTKKEKCGCCVCCLDKNNPDQPADQCTCSNCTCCK